MRLALALVSLAACGGSPVKTPNNVAADPPVPALPGDGDRAFVADESGLVEVARPGVTQVIAKQGVLACHADARGQVVWFTTQAGLHAFDLVDRRVHTVIRAPLGQIEAIIHWDKTDQLGGESRLGFDVGVGLHLDGKPRLEMEMGCEGDRMVYCREDGSDTWKPEVLAMQKTAGALTLADPSYVATVAARGASRSLWTPPPMPPTAPKAPAIDKARCDADPDQCGALTAIPGNPLWLVVTGNSRGDYFHEDRELWDPASGEYLRFAEGAVARSKTPPEDGGADYGGLRASTTGMLSYQGAVFDARAVGYAPKGDGKTCGFARGGWRIKGPTDL